MDNTQKLHLEQKLNLELETEIFLWTHGDKEDLYVSMLTEKTRKNKLKYFQEQKRQSDSRLQTLLSLQEHQF
jgi:hypothetical protein